MRNFLRTKATSALLAAGFICLGLRNVPAAFIPLNTQSNYFQNFDSLKKSGKGQDKTLPSGWSIAENGDGDSKYRADNGGRTDGGIYSYGAVGSTDRALGSLRQDGDFGVFGASFENTSGG